MEIHIPLLSLQKTEYLNGNCLIMKLIVIVCQGCII